MGCRFSEDKIKGAIKFHGHSCPGLAIGIRAAEYALDEFPSIDKSDLLCITETDMCAVDGIQYLTGCTFGKGNLIHRDFGKAAFSFYNKRNGKGIRLLFSAENIPGEDKDSMKARLMSARLENLFHLQNLNTEPPKGARVLKSQVCESCGEKTMESRTRRFDGKILCIPCFGTVEQK